MVRFTLNGWELWCNRLSNTKGLSQLCTSAGCLQRPFFFLLVSGIEGSSSGWTLLWHFQFSCLTANFFVLNIYIYIYILPYSAKNKIIKTSALMGVIK